MSKKPNLKKPEVAHESSFEDIPEDPVDSPEEKFILYQVLNVARTASFYEIVGSKAEIL